MSFLTLTDVAKSFGDLQAVADVNLSVEKGEFVSLLGPSGCGKTTTLQMIAGFVETTRGRITLDGRDITHMKPNKRGLGIVFQSYALFPHMSVTDNVGFGLEMRNIDKAERKERVRDALALVRLDTLAHRFPRELSGGQRQRVAIARAIVIAPPVLLSPPEHDGAPWAVSSDAADRPLRSDAQVDGATGRLVGRVAFAERHWIDRVIGYGIAAHEGALFGIANQILGTLTALWLVVLAVSGGVMWWRRRPTGLLGAPVPSARPRYRPALVAAIAGLGIYMPLFGLTLVVVAIVERVLLRRLPQARRWLGLEPSGLHAA